MGPPKKSWKKQFADGFRATVAFVFSKVGICVLVIGYLFVGAAMFQQLEGPEEAMLRFPVAKYRSKIVKDLWKITEEYNTLHPTNWTDEVTQIMKDYQTFVVKVRIHQIVSPISNSESTNFSTNIQA